MGCGTYMYRELLTCETCVCVCVCMYVCMCACIHACVCIILTLAVRAPYDAWPLSKTVTLHYRYVHDISCTYGFRRFISAFRRAHCTLNQIILMPIVTHYLFNVHFNIIIPCSYEQMFPFYLPTFFYSYTFISVMRATYPAISSHICTQL